MDVKIKRLHPDAIQPTYAHLTDAAMDLYSLESVFLWPMKPVKFRTGWAVEIPAGYFGLIRPRSGMGTQDGISYAGSGIIDRGYRGEIMVGLINNGPDAIKIDAGQRIAQMAVLPYAKANLIETDELTASDRGDNGHGSTGE